MFLTIKLCTPAELNICIKMDLAFKPTKVDMLYNPTNSIDSLEKQSLLLPIPYAKFTLFIEWTLY